MSNPTNQRWRQLAQKMVYSISEDDTAAIKSAVVSRYHKRILVQKVSIGVLSVVLVAIVGASTFRHFSHIDRQGSVDMAEAPSSMTTNTPLSPPIETASGNERVERGNVPDNHPLATPLTPGTRFSVEEELAVSAYRITEGSVRFQTHPSDPKKLEVRVGELVIEDIGTIFSVEVLPQNQVRVAVDEGKVKVTWPTGHAALEQGSDGLFPSNGDAAHENDLISDAVPNRDTTDWRAAAKSGNYKLAALLIEKQPALVRVQMADLMLAADVMRLTHRPKDGATYLKQAVQLFPNDPQRAAAAFTLGKVFLNDLNQPANAAKAFSIAAKNNSPLAEEATAREAEAWYRAHRPDNAKSTAKAYLQKFPNGARAESMRTFCE